MLLTPGFHKERFCVMIISESGCRECGCLKKAQTGQIRKAGRVDHRDAFLDTEELYIGTRPHYTSICRPRLHRFMITAWRSLSIGRKKHSLPIFAKC